MMTVKMLTISHLKIKLLVQDPPKTQRDKKAEPSFSPPRLLTGSSTRILKYVEDLKRGSNAEVGPKDYFEIAYIMGTVNKPYAMRREI
jgi:hypothetical protein